MTLLMLPTSTWQAVCFVRPTRDNVTALKRELRQPRFQSYHFCECRLPLVRVCVCLCTIHSDSSSNSGFPHTRRGSRHSVTGSTGDAQPPCSSSCARLNALCCAVPSRAVRCADFSNLVSQMHLQDLAEADAAQEQVQAVQEFYADFIALDKHHFTVPVPCNDVLINPRAAAALGGSE